MVYSTLFLCKSYLSSNLILPGYWSTGTRLADGTKVSGQGLDTGTLPEYMVCIISLHLRDSISANLNLMDYDN